MKYKKILLGLGSLATVVAPISTIIACGKDEKAKETPVKTDQQIVDEAKEEFVHASSSKDKGALKTSMDGKVAEDAVTMVELGYTAPALAEGVSVTYAIKTAYDETSQKVVIIATITKGGVNTTKELEITAMSDAVVANAAVQALTSANLNVRVDDQQLPSVVVAITDTKTNILTAIKDTITNNDEAKALIVVGDITLTAADEAGTLTVTIANHGDSKELTIPGFKVDLTTEANKLQNFTTADAANKSGNDFTGLTAGATDVKDKFILISDYASDGKLYSSALMEGVTIAKVVIQTAYNTTSKIIVFTITLAKANVANVTSETKDITVTFN